MNKWLEGKIYQNDKLPTNFRLITEVKDVCDCTIVTYLYILDWDNSKGNPTLNNFVEFNHFNKTYKKNPEGFFTQI